MKQVKQTKKPRGRPPGSKNKLAKQFKSATKQSIKYTALNVPKYELNLLCYTDEQLITVTNLLRNNNIGGLIIKSI